MYNKYLPTTITNSILKIYMVGAMENPAKKDDGEGWRKILTPKLNELGIYCFDPTKEETKKVGMPTAELIRKLNFWQKNQMWDKFTEYMGKIWRGVTTLDEDHETLEPKMIHVLGDIDYVERSDFLVFNYNEGDILGGTIAELTIAWYRGIPVYLVTDADYTKLNKSILYFVLDSGHGRGKIFKNQEELISHIIKDHLNKCGCGDCKCGS